MSTPGEVSLNSNGSLDPRKPNDTSGFDPIWSETERQQLRRIATNHSIESVRHPELDPVSKSFDLYQWMKYQLQLFEAGAVKPRHTGVVFKDLSVYGSGAEIKLQQTVGSILTSPLRLKGITAGHKMHKTILHHFDGVVKRGEMLLVLGRPGAGCSTFLKSISADLEGLKIDDAARVSYDGIPQKVMRKEFKGEILYNQEVEKRGCPPMD